MSLGKKVASSAILLLLRKIWGNLINLVVMAFLARILSKEDFGLLAISSVFLSFINTVATSGIAEYVIYYDGDDRNQKINAAFWLNLLMTLIVIVIVIIVSPYWGNFYGNEKVQTLLIILLISFFFEMGSTVPKALLRKELNYKTIVYFSSVSMTIVSVGKLAAAFMGLGVFSLALPQALVSPILMMAFYIKIKWKPLNSFGTVHFLSIFNYTKHVIGGRVLTKIVNEGDNLIVGKLIGLEGLGVYALAFQLANLVTNNVVFLVNDIFLPLFSKVRDDVEKIRSVYLRMIQFLSFISFPLITLLLIFASPIVLLFYGTSWSDAVLPSQILSLFALGRSLSSPSSSLFNAMGKPEIGFRFTLFFTPFFLLSVLAGSYYGVIGVAITTTCIRLLGSIISLSIALSLIQQSLSNLFHVVKSNLTISFGFIISFILISLETKIEFVPLSLLFAPFVLYFHYLTQRLLFVSSFTSFMADLVRYLNILNFQRIVQIIFFIKTKIA